MKLKVGDKVKQVKADYGISKRGWIGTVLKVSPWGGYLVQFENWSSPLSINTNHLELVNTLPNYVTRSPKNKRGAHV